MEYAGYIEGSGMVEGGPWSLMLVNSCTGSREIATAVCLHRKNRCQVVECKRKEREAATFPNRMGWVWLIFFSPSNSIHFDLQEKCDFTFTLRIHSYTIQLSLCLISLLIALWIGFVQRGG